MLMYRGHMSVKNYKNERVKFLSTSPGAGISTTDVGRNNNDFFPWKKAKLASSMRWN